jgi:heat shock factor-binding protein 1
MAASLSNDTTTTDASAQRGEEEDLDVFVKELMENMQTRFNRLSDTIVGRIDDMGAKIDELEKSLNELMDQAGVESTPSDSLAKSDVKGTANVKR